jgi:hypothetical protein
MPCCKGESDAFRRSLKFETGETPVLLHRPDSGVHSFDKPALVEDFLNA